MGTKAFEAVQAILRYAKEDGDLAYLIGPGSTTFEALAAAVAEHRGCTVEEAETGLSKHLSKTRWPRRRFDVEEVMGLLEHHADIERADPLPISDADLARIRDIFEDELGKTDEEIEALDAERAADEEQAARQAEIARVQVPLFTDKPVS